MQDPLWFLNEAGAYFCRYASAMFVQAGILIIFLSIVDLLIRKYVRAVFRYGIWMLVLVKLVLPPGLCLPTGIGYWYGLDTGSVTGQVSSEPPKNDTHDVIASPEASSTPKHATNGPEHIERQKAMPEFSLPDEDLAIAAPLLSGEIQAESVKITASSTPVTWQAIVFLVWLFGVFILFVLLLQRYFFVRCLLADSEKAPGSLEKMLRECCLQMGIHRRLVCRLANAVMSPAVCALMRPVILMPATLVGSFNEEKLKVILLHELAHIKRGDLWINFVQTVLHILHFYNPLLCFANAKIRRIREKAVDEMVLTHMGRDVEVYSNTLLDITEIALSRTQLSLRLVGVVESKKALSGRIKHLLRHPIPKSAKLGITRLVAIFITAAILLPMARAVEKQAPESAIEELKSVSHDTPPDRTYAEPTSLSVAEGEESRFLIKGRVTNAQGRALKGNDDIVVDAWAQIQQGRRKGQYEIIAQAYAHIENGTYEIKNLDGRPVYVMARDDSPNYKHSPNPPTFYPGTPSRDEAQLISFANRPRHWGIDIPMSRQGACSLKGRVTDRATGKPISKALVTVYHRDMLFDIFSTYTNSQGRYTFSAMGRGQFIVHVDIRARGYVKTRRQVAFTKDRSHVELDFDLQKGVSIRGDVVDTTGFPFKRYIADQDIPPGQHCRSYGFVKQKGEDKNIATEFKYANQYAPKHLRQSTSVWYEEGEGECTRAYMTYPINFKAPDNRSFQIPAVIPGELQFYYQPWRNDLRVKQILHQSKDITQTGLVAHAGRDIEGIKIVLEKYEGATATRDAGTQVSRLSQSEKDLIAKIASTNRANRKRVHALDIRYQRSYRGGRTRSGRYAFSSDRIYHRSKDDRDEPGFGVLFIKSDERVWERWHQSPYHNMIFLNDERDRMSGGATGDPWFQMDGDIGANLDRYTSVKSVEKQMVNGKPVVIVKIEYHYNNSIENRVSSHKICYFSVSDGYLPIKLESRSFNKFGALKGSYYKEYSKISHYPVNGAVFYLPVEFEAKFYDKSKRCNNTTQWRIPEETVRINPNLPDSLFTAPIRRPGDMIIDKARNLKWKEPPAGSVGNPAPDFSLQNLNNKEEISLGDIDRSVIVLGFGSTRNGAHQGNLSKLESLQTWARTDNKSVAFYSITDDPIDQINTFRKERACPIPFLYDPQGAVRRLYQSEQHACVVIISRGIIRLVHIDEMSDELALEQHFKELITTLLDGKEIKNR